MRHAVQEVMKSGTSAAVAGERALPDGAAGAARHALAVLFLTSVHHAYGAYVYETPWRYHAVFISAAAALVILGSLTVLRRTAPGFRNNLATGLFVVTILAVPVLTIGLFEGLYNHVVKNLLYFAGGSVALMTRLFPAPTYEMPNDAFFEITGMLQAIPAAFAGWHVVRVLRGR